MAQQTTDAWDNVRKIHRDYSFFYQIGGGLLLVLLGVVIGAALSGNNGVYWAHVLLQVLGIGFALFVLDQRAERRRMQDQRERLLHQVRSHSNDLASDAIDELHHRGWLKGEVGSSRVDLQACKLEYSIVSPK